MKRSQLKLDPNHGHGEFPPDRILAQNASRERHRVRLANDYC